MLFLKEFCTFSQTLQPQNRENFFKALAALGILPTLEVILSMDDMAIKLASVDILTYVVEYSPSMVREYALQQEASQDEVRPMLFSVPLLTIRSIAGPVHR